MSQLNNTPLLPEEPPVRMTRSKRTPQSIASSMGSWILSAIWVIGWLVLAAGAVTGALLAIQALIFVYRMGVTALGVESHG